MKSFFEKIIVLISEVVMLILAILWYFQDKSKEPLIAMIALGVSVIVTLFFRFTRNSDEKSNTNTHNEAKSKGDKNIIIQGNNGKITFNRGIK